LKPEDIVSFNIADGPTARQQALGEGLLGDNDWVGRDDAVESDPGIGSPPLRIGARTMSPEAMRKLSAAAKRFAQGQEGATMVEYGLMLALIAVVCMVAVQQVGNSASGLFDGVAGSL
jgi:pilus assembly protein Flp/PilA